MKILGFDPGYEKIGYGLIKEKGHSVVYLASGLITTHKDIKFQDRLHSIYLDACQLIKSMKPDVIVVEEIFFAINAKTAIKVAHARGVLLSAASAHHTHVVEYTPQQVKLKFAGYGRASKKEIQQAVERHLDILVKEDNTADALAIACCHASFSRRDMYN